VLRRNSVFGRVDTGRRHVVSVIVRAIVHTHQLGVLALQGVELGRRLMRSHMRLVALGFMGAASVSGMVVPEFALGSCGSVLCVDIERLLEALVTLVVG